MSIHGSTISILDLPIGTCLTFDGKPIILKRDDFVAFHQIPCGDFHFVSIIIQPKDISGQEDLTRMNSKKFRHGFIFHSDASNWIMVYRYNPHTEEVDANPMDVPLVDTLESAIRTMSIDPNRLLPFSSIENDDWKSMTSYITSKVLQQNQPAFRRRKLKHGTKVIPGSYDEDKDSSCVYLDDGQEWIVPPIPVGIFMSSSQIASSSFVSRWHRHVGTRRFLLTLKSPNQRTQFATATEITDIWNYVMETYYHNQLEYLLGDFQLAFVFFLHLHCYTSFEYWKDLIAMISFLSLHNVTTVHFWNHFSNTLLQHMKYMDSDFFNDFELSGDNFFRPAIDRLLNTLEASQDTMLHTQALNMKREASRLFSTFVDDHNCYAHDKGFNELKDDSDEDPIVVSTEEYESMITSTSQSNYRKLEYPNELRLKYPILFAAMQPHEDILMVCARALDSKSDVSLVREAADFLEQVVASGVGEALHL
jgi:AAR2 protein